jgi:hypothetical protein
VLAKGINSQTLSKLIKKESTQFDEINEAEGVESIKNLKL